jgi:hypothetical protein
LVQGLVVDDFIEMLKQVQHDISGDFSFATQSPRGGRGIFGKEGTG